MKLKYRPEIDSLRAISVLGVIIYHSKKKNYQLINISMDNLVIIHIGKCGGSTVCNELESNNIKFSIYAISFFSNCWNFCRTLFILAWNISFKELEMFP